MADILNQIDPAVPLDSSSQRPGVSLRRPVESDRSEFVALRRSSAEFLSPWEPHLWEGDGQCGDPTFDRLLTRRELETDEPFLISRTSDGAIVGYVGLAQIHRGPFRSCVVGYWIGSSHLGRGYGTGGVRACLDVAFMPEGDGGLGLHRVEANVIPTNLASLALVKRLGFRKEGFSLRYLEIAGRWRDHERWAITAEEWNGRSDDRPVDHALS